MYKRLHPPFLVFASLAVGLISDQKENFSFGNHPTKQLPQLSCPVPQMCETIVTRLIFILFL